MARNNAVQDPKKPQSIAENRKAFHDYHILETFEAGVVLQGTEVKAIREGRVNLRDSYARVEQDEVFLYNVHISPVPSIGDMPTTSPRGGASYCSTARKSASSLARPSNAA